jgi:hypothetical protein
VTSHLEVAPAGNDRGCMVTGKNDHFYSQAVGQYGVFDVTATVCVNSCNAYAQD